MSSLTQYRVLPTAFIAIAIAASSNCLPAASASASTDVANDGDPVVATEQPAPPGTGPNAGDDLRAQMQARPGAATVPMKGDAIHDGFGQPLIARELPAPPGTGPNSGDLARAELQNDATAFAALGTRYPLAPGASGIAKVDPNNAELFGRGGWNPALVELQAHAQPLPWQTHYASTTSDPAAKVDAKP